MEFAKVAIIGAGTMGSGIATALAQQGVAINLIDTSDAAVARGLAAAHGFYDKAAEKGRMDAAAVAAAKARITGNSDLAAVVGCDLVIEAVFEELSVKKQLFQAIAPFIGPDVVVATNTSALRVSDLAAAIARPERFLGLHYFNPAAINPIVEVVRGDKTDAGIYQRALEFCRQTQKKPIACKDSFGFAINRFFIPYGNEAIRLLDEGVASPGAIDAIAKDCLGVAAGPFQVMNLVKPKIMYHAQQHLAPHGPFYALAKGLQAIGNQDHLFDLDGTADGLDAATARKIADRLCGAVFIPVLQALDEGVASPADIDMGASLALRFGKMPCALMDNLGHNAVAAMVEPLARAHQQPIPHSLARVGSLLGG